MTPRFLLTDSGKGTEEDRGRLYVAGYFDTREEAAAERTRIRSAAAKVADLFPPLAGQPPAPRELLIWRLADGEEADG